MNRILLICFASLVSAQSIEQKTQGACSPAVNAKETVTITCNGVGAEELKKLDKGVAILNAILRQNDAEIMSRLDQILYFLLPIKDQALKQAPRVLNGVQASALSEALRQFAGQKIHITADERTAETLDFAHDVESVLRAAGWNVEFGSGLMFSSGGVCTGAELSVKSATEHPKGAEHLINALLRMGYGVRGVANPALAADMINLVICQKPAR